MFSLSFKAKLANASLHLLQLIYRLGEYDVF